ncbi:unnamed protein product, partial [Closterium sp. NIES-53]
VDYDPLYDDAKEDEELPEIDPNMHADPKHRWDIATMAVKEALASWKGEAVKAAMEEEIRSLIGMGTWELVERPRGVNIMKNRWVLTTKYCMDDTVEREKARLVVKGFTQVCGAGYDKTYSPVSSYVTLRIFLSIVVVLDLNLMQLDMKNAFLQSKLDRVFYMYQPDYFNDGTGRASSTRSRAVESRRRRSRELTFDDEDAQERKEEYRQKVGSLQFTATMTRPDIAFAYSKLGSGLTVRSDQHWREVDRCLAYLADTHDTTLEFSGGPESLELIGYVDADDADEHGRLCYVAATDAGKEGCRLCFLLAEFKLLDAGKPTILRVDNKSAIMVAEGLGLTGYLKHMERRYAWLQQMVRHGKFVLKYIPTTEQPGDFLTKALHFPAFNRCSVTIGQVRLDDVGNSNDDVQQGPKRERGRGVLTEVKCWPHPHLGNADDLVGCTGVAADHPQWESYSTGFVELQGTAVVDWVICSASSAEARERRQVQTIADGCTTVQVGPIICAYLRVCALLSSMGQRWTATLLQRWHIVDLLCWQVAFLQCWHGSSMQRWQAVDHAVLATGVGGAGPSSPGGTADAGGAGGAASARGARAGGIGGAGAVVPRGARTGGAGVVGAGDAARTRGSGAAGAGGVVRAGGATGASGSGGTGGTAGAGGAGAAGAGGTAGAGGATGAAGTGGVGGTAGAGGAGAGGTGGAGGATGATSTESAGGTTGARGPGAAGASGAASAGGAGGAAGAAGARGAGAAGAGGAGAADQSQPQLLPGSPLLAPAPHIEVIESLTERREPETRASTPVRACRVARPRPPGVPGTHGMALRLSFVPNCVVLPENPASSLPHVPDPDSDLARAARRTVTHLLATVVTDPDLESTAAFPLVAQLVDFAGRSRLDYVASLVTESEPVCPPSARGELALGNDVLEDRQFDLECLAAALPHFASMLLCPKGDPDALDIHTPRSYTEAIAGTYVDKVPPPGVNIVDGMWIFRVKRPPGSPPAFKARYVARGFRQPQWVDFFKTFSPTPKMTSLRVLLHVAAQHDYELHSLDFSTAFLQGSLHEEIWLRRPPGFTGSFPADTQWSLQQPVYGLCQAPREWHNTLRTTLAALGFAPSSADPLLFLRTDTTLPLFSVLVYVDDLVFATADTEALGLVKAELQERHTCTDLGPSALRLPVLLATAHSSVYWPACSQLHLRTSPSSRVVRTQSFTTGMGLVLGGQGAVVLTGHSDASWADDQATQRSSQGYTFSLGSGSVSWRSTRSSSVLSSSCEAEIYAGAMAAQELRWLTYLLTDLGEQPRSPPVLYVDNKAMLALCHEQRLEHRTKHIALCYFLARELQQRRQLRLSYVASRANTADVFTKALGSGDHQRFCIALGLVPTLPHVLVA